MLEQSNHLAINIFGLLNGKADGPIAIVALIFIVLVTVLLFAKRARR